MLRSARSAAGPDARELQQLGRSDAARRQNGFGCRLREASTLMRVSELDPFGPQNAVAAAYPDALDQRLRHHREIRTRQRGPEKRFRRVPPHAALLVHLEEGAAGIVAAVELANFRNAAFLRRIAPGFENLPTQP